MFLTIGNCSPQSASERDRRGARTDQPQGLLVPLQAWLLQQQPGEHAEQTGADSGQRTEQTFGIPGTIPIFSLANIALLIQLARFASLA